MDDEVPHEDLVPRQDPDAGGSDLDVVTGDSTLSALTAEISEERKFQSNSKEQAIKSDKENLAITAAEKVSTDTGQVNPISGDHSSTSDHHSGSLSINAEKGSADLHGDLENSKKEAETRKTPMSPRSTESLKKGSSSGASIHATGHDSKVDPAAMEAKKIDGLEQLVNDDATILTRESCEADGIVAEKFETASDASPQIKSPNSSPNMMVKFESGSDSLPLIQIPNAVGPSSSWSNQEKFNFSITSEKSVDKLQPRRNPETSIHITHSPSATPEKPSEDGFNWRKYGQKIVKGNEFVRSYYRCTYLNCVAKKQVERSNVGQITDINYIGEHEHPRPQYIPQVGIAVVQPPPIRKPELSVVSIPEGITDVQPLPMKKPELPILSSPKAGRSSASLRIVSQFVDSKNAAPPSTPTKDSPSNSTRDEVDNTSCPDMKRQKMDIPSSNDSVLNQQSSEPRQVVQTMSEVDLVNDGYRWRKYGQKLVKGNPNPRSYYRCSNAGCPVKKHVERASHDPKLVITTYEGQHGHDMPFSRTVTHNTPGGGVTAVTGESRSSDTGENKTNGVEMVKCKLVNLPS